MTINAVLDTLQLGAAGAALTVVASDTVFSLSTGQSWIAAFIGAAVMVSFFALRKKA